MEFTTLGRKGLSASVLGLGCGGHSRLGLSQGRQESDAAGVVRAALDLGVNFIDTAEAYGTESAVGLALEGTDRSRVILSTKAGVGWQDRRSTAAEVRSRVEASLRRLRTDYIDIFHVHGVRIEEYSYSVEALVPTLLDMKAEGKIRFLGITEAFAPDPSHGMLTRAIQDDCWEVMMVGFNILNQSAREKVLRVTQEKGIGTLCMFAVRRALSQPEALRELVQKLLDEGVVSGIDASDPLGFLVSLGVAGTVQEAAYRFCRWEPGIDVVLSGTGNIEHLKDNAEALALPALPDDVLARLRAMFNGVDSVSGN